MTSTDVRKCTQKYFGLIDPDIFHATILYMYIMNAIFYEMAMFTAVYNRTYYKLQYNGIKNTLHYCIFDDCFN
jgi:hypothetical protein